MNKSRQSPGRWYVQADSPSGSLTKRSFLMGLSAGNQGFTLENSQGFCRCSLHPIRKVLHFVMPCDWWDNFLCSHGWFDFNILQLYKSPRIPKMEVSNNGDTSKWMVLILANPQMDDDRGFPPHVKPPNSPRSAPNFSRRFPGCQGSSPQPLLSCHRLWWLEVSFPRPGQGKVRIRHSFRCVLQVHTHTHRHIYILLDNVYLHGQYIYIYTHWTKYVYIYVHIALSICNHGWKQQPKWNYKK